MPPNKHRLHNTQTDNLISNLRGEVGEVISTWVLARGLMAEAAALRTGEIEKDFENKTLATLHVLEDKLTDEIVARLSELAERKIGRLNFYFAHRKLGALETEVEQFHHYVDKSGIKHKRNHDISHKELPEKWTDHRFVSIPYPTLVKGVVHALRLMKKIDEVFLGPSAKYLWGEMRKKRYSPLYPVTAGYMVLPYLHLAPESRIRVLQEEAAAGRSVWEDMPTKVNGKPTVIKASKKWGILLLGRGMLVLDKYPLLELSEITIGPKEAIDSASIPDNAESSDA